MSARRIDLVAPPIDLAFAIASGPLVALLRQAYETPRGANSIVFFGAIATFCGALWLARRLPHDDGAFASNASLNKPAGWLALSTILTTCLLLAGAGLTAGEATGLIMDGDGAISWVLGWLVVAILFAPIAFAWSRSPTEISPKHRTRTEAAVLTLANVTLVVSVSLWELLFFGDAGLDRAAMPWWAFAGFSVIGVPMFLMLCGAPRVMLLARRFTWVGVVSLVASTTWYLYASLGRPWVLD